MGKERDRSGWLVLVGLVVMRKMMSVMWTFYTSIGLYSIQVVSVGATVYGILYVIMEGI